MGKGQEINFLSLNKQKLNNYGSSLTYLLKKDFYKNKGVHLKK